MPKKILRAGRFSLELGRKTFIMGVVNLTPDSFSRDGRLVLEGGAVSQAGFARSLIAQGADIIDIGGHSTRPRAAAVSTKEELRRILPALKLLAPKSPVPISVDTYKTDVARAALDEGADIINNVRGVAPQRQLVAMARDYGAAIVLMHSRGTPRTMQAKASYREVVKDVIEELRRSVQFCLEIGVKKDRIIVDPGIGFAKTPGQNLRLLSRLDEFKALDMPVLVGTSRKSFIGHVLGKEVHERAWGTAATVALAIERGADIVRVHDVAAMKDVAAMSDALVR